MDSPHLDPLRVDGRCAQAEVLGEPQSTLLGALAQSRARFHGDQAAYDKRTLSAAVVLAHADRN